jgi:hypothetical protein
MFTFHGSNNKFGNTLIHKTMVWEDIKVIPIFFDSLCNYGEKTWLMDTNNKP